MLKRLLTEPFFHFVILALLIFGAWRIGSDASEPERDTIVVSGGKIEQLTLVFAKVRQRPPTPSELKGLIDDYVKEEIYFREAMALGLEEGDAVIRRRLRQKMEFLGTAESETAAPTDAELGAYLAANPRKFEIGPQIALRQVFVNPRLHGDRAKMAADSLLERLLSEPKIDFLTLGDPTMLPHELPLSPASAIAQIYGEEFIAEIGKAETGIWHGPVSSGFGLHLVQVDERVPGRIPALDEARDAVTREWRNARRQEMEERRLAEFLKRYRVVIETPAAQSQ